MASKKLFYPNNAAGTPKVQRCETDGPRNEVAPRLYVRKVSARFLYRLQRFWTALPYRGQITLNYRVRYETRHVSSRRSAVPKGLKARDKSSHWDGDGSQTACRTVSVWGDAPSTFLFVGMGTAPLIFDVGGIQPQYVVPI